MDLGGGRAAFVLTALIVVGWFALGTLLNIRRGNRLLRWFQPGMTLLGERTTLRWLGSSGVELKVQHALPPLKSAEVFVLLEPRDLPLLWWLFRARGRRDLLIVRAELRAAPRFELEALHPRAWSTRGVARALEGDRWTPAPLPSGSPLVAYQRGGGPGGAGGHTVPEMLAGVALGTLPLVRLAVRRTTPNLEVQWEVRGLDRAESHDVVEAFRRLAQRL